MKITSLQNEKVKQWVKLQNKKERDKKGLFLIEGDHLLQEAIKRNCVIEIITINPYKEDNIPVYEVTKEIMKKISEQQHGTEIMAIVKKEQHSLKPGNILFLDGIQDPGNLGTMIRSAVAFSIENVVLSEDCVDLYNSKVIRSTEGMLFHSNIFRVTKKDFLEKIVKNYTILGTDVSNGKDVTTMKIKKPYCLIIGNEGKGMSDLARSYCHDFLYIPMNKSCESLNAGVSASILMYELRKEK